METINYTCNGSKRSYRLMNRTGPCYVYGEFFNNVQDGPWIFSTPTMVKQIEFDLGVKVKSETFDFETGRVHIRWFD